MKKIIRLTESDLTRIVRRVVKESEQKAQFQNALKKLENSGCWSKAKYPNLWRISSGSLSTVMCILGLVFGALTAEIGGAGLAIIIGSLATVCPHGIENLIDTEKAKLLPEVKSLLKCLAS